jgi:hypothetical protein
MIIFTLNLVSNSIVVTKSRIWVSYKFHRSWIILVNYGRVIYNIHTLTLYKGKGRENDICDAYVIP